MAALRGGLFFMSEVPLYHGHVKDTHGPLIILLLWVAVADRARFGLSTHCDRQLIAIVNLSRSSTYRVVKRRVGIEAILLLETRIVESCGEHGRS